MSKPTKERSGWRKLIGAVLLTSCLDSGGAAINSDRRNLVLQDLASNVAVPMYATFSARSRALATQVDAFCAAPDLPKLAMARAAWTTARAAWKQADVLKFGPYLDAPLRVGPKVDFWPARTDAIDGVLASSMPLEAVGALEPLPATVKGLPVIEYLLFWPLPEAEQLALFTSDIRAPRRCAYLRALGNDLAANAQLIYEAWRPEGGNYARALTHAGRTNSIYPSLAAAVSELLNRLTFLVEDIRTHKLGRPLGQAAGGVPQPELAESRFAGNALADVRENLAGVQAIATGRYMNSAGLGLLSLLPPLSSLPARFDTELAASLQAISLVPEPLSIAVTTQPATVAVAIEALKKLQLLLQVEVAPAIGATVTFSDNDGD